MRTALGRLATLAVALAAVCTSRAADSGAYFAFEFALIGDVPYSEEHATNDFPNLIAELNQHQAELAFVVHDGDIKSGSAPCTIEWFRRCYDQFQTFESPLIYVFGDNEWSDCVSRGPDQLDPAAALAKLREMFCRGDQSLGRRTLRLTRQSERDEFAVYRENVRWSYGGVTFVGLNIVGDANNFGKPEFAGREQANLAWLKESFAFATARQHLAVMIVIQANPRYDLAATNKLRAGFNAFLTTLEHETIAFEKPVVLVHGDTHYFRIDKPMLGSASKRRVENFTRVETFGNPDIHWLRASVDPADPMVFTFRERIVAKNKLSHR